MAEKSKKFLRKKKKNLKVARERKKDADHSYNMNYNNWSQRGSACFNEIRRVGIRFIDELLRTNLVSEDLSTFGTSLSSASDYVNESPTILDNISESPYSEGSKEFAEDLWYTLCNVVKNRPILVSFQYQVEKEKWIEIKRNFNIFQIDGETIPDISLKVVLRTKDNRNILAYYLRCLGKLIKIGRLSSKFDVLNIIKIFNKNKYICIGLDKDQFIYQVDDNEKIRQYIKEYGSLSTVPFDSIHHTDCKAIVEDSLEAENYKFKRGEKIICGPLVVCKPCEDLYYKLEELSDHSLNFEREDRFKPPRHRYGPVENLIVSTKIKKLCTESVIEFVKDAQKEMECFRKLGIETGIIPREPKLLPNADSSEDERPTVTVSEQEFEQMFTVKNSSDGSSNKRLDKICDKCGYEADSMLSLFTHMSSHIVSSFEGSGVRFSSSELEHKETMYPEDKVCLVCRRTNTRSKYCCHVNSESLMKPYLCFYCDLRTQTLEEYKNHMKNVHHMSAIEEMNFICAICQTYFYTRNHLVIHQLNLNHLDKGGVKCSVCGCNYSSVASFQSHVLNYSPEERENHNLVLCLECRKFFFSKLELGEHLKRKQCSLKRKHEGEHQTNKAQDNKNVKLYTCGKCYKTLSTGNALQKHLESCHSIQGTNDGEPATSETNVSGTPSESLIYSFACSLCGVKCTSEYYLNIHMNLHATSNRTVFHTSDDYFYHKRNPEIGDEPSKQMEKHEQQILHQQTQQLPSYNQVYNQQSTFTEGQATQSDVMEVSSPEIDWSKQTISTIEEHSDTVYSLLHL